MYKTFEQIDVENISLEEFKVLAEDENVYMMYNVYHSLNEFYKKHDKEEVTPEECWRLKPLKKICSDDAKLLDFYEKYINKETWHIKAWLQSFVRIEP